MVSRTVIIGAGPASLVAAYKLANNAEEAVVIDSAADLSDLSTVDCLSDCFDPKAQNATPETKDLRVLQEKILGHSPPSVPRTGRIFYRYRLFDYPLSVANTFKNLGPIDTSRTVLSYLHTQSQLQANTAVESFEDLITAQFGRYLYRSFFKPYAEKLWGMPARSIPAEWAAQPLPAPFIPKAIWDEPLNRWTDELAVNPQLTHSKPKRVKTKRDTFWQSCQHLIEAAGSTVDLNTRLLQIEHTGRRLSHAVVQKGGAIALNSGDHFISNLPVGELVARLHPPAPPAVIEAVKALRYRDLIVVALTIGRDALFSESSLYIHSPKFRVSRIQNYQNWRGTARSALETTSLGMEYFCAQGDALCQMTDAALVELAKQELAGLGLVTEAALITAGTVIRRKQAYPLYTAGYNPHIALLQDYLQKFENLQRVGCNGLHWQGTQTDAMLTGLSAARNIIVRSRADLGATRSDHASAHSAS